MKAFNGINSKLINLLEAVEAVSANWEYSER